MLGGALGGVLGFIGQSQTNQKNWDISQSANAASAAQAQAQMQFQERMRDTQYQTAVSDMKKAGLNPMLAYSQGGAGVPTGAMGSVTTAKMENALGSGVAGYQQMRTNDADIDLKEATTTATSANSVKTEAETIKVKADIEKIMADTDLSKQQLANYKILLDKLNEEILNLRATRGLTTATARNVEANIAPSVDPYWYRDLKKNFPTPSNVENYVKNKYKQLRGKK
jgi:hypothetical protein